MHSLIFKRSELPKKMEQVKEPFDTEEGCEVDDQHDDDINLFRTPLPPSSTTPVVDYCQPCNLPTSNLQVVNSLPHSSTCSYGIQALLHRERSTPPNHIVNNSLDHDDDDSSLNHDSDILRQWKRKKEEELQERKKESQAKLDHVLEQAAIERESFYKEREAHIEAKKRLNREREAKYHADVEAKQQEQLAGGNLWEAVAALIDLHGDGDANKPASAGSTGGRHSLSPKGRADAHHQFPVSNKSKQESAKSRQRDLLPKPAKKSTDLSRMREPILKSSANLEFQTQLSYQNVLG